MKKTAIIISEQQFYNMVRNAILTGIDDQPEEDSDVESDDSQPDDNKPPATTAKSKTPTTTPKPDAMQKKPTQKGNEQFTTLNLNTPVGFRAYIDICSRYINTRKSNLLKITGEMMANAAKNAFNNTGVYVPPELALAQLAIEGGFVNNPNARPIRTKNPFNVGNVDTGANKYLPDVSSGIQLYYDKMAKLYLGDGKTPESLLNNFVNKSGRRYASAPNYESSVKNIVNQIKNISAPIYANINKNANKLI